MTPSARVAGAVLALTVALASAGGAAAAARGIGDARRDEAARAAATDAARLEAAFDQAALAVEALAEGPAVDGVAAFRTAAPVFAERTAIHTVALATLAVDGDAVVSTVSPAPRAGLARGDSLSFGQAVSTAVATTKPVIGVEGRRVAAVAPVSAAPADAPVAERRAATTAVVAGELAIDELVAGLFDGADVRLESGRDVVVARGDADGSLLSTTVRAGSEVWALAVDEPSGGAGSVPWAILLGGLLLAAGAGLALGSAVAAARRAEQRADDRTRQLGRIAETGGSVQQSLDLGELLPAFAITLADEFDLRHVSISLVDDEGREVEAFTTGDRATGPETFSLPLRRGWRHVGVLTVRPRRTLDHAETTSLQALGDLLAVALTNARLLQREQEAAGRLRELDALKNAFLGTVSHELRTSITAIMGFGELLVEAWDELSDERRRELAARVRRSAGSLRHLVDDLLDFARLEQQRLRVSPRELDLADAVRQTVDSLRSLLSEHELELDLEPTTAWVDPIAVERIVANLVSNAAKYAPAGSTVRVSVGLADGRARLVVADQGPGIPEAERSRIFVRFYRLDTQETLRTRGAGIGLSILRDFVDRSGATVAVDDAPGGGARFTIDFPTEAAPEAVPEPAGGRVL